MPVAQTSRITFQYLPKDEIGKQEKNLLYLYAMHGPLSDAEAAAMMRLPRSTVSARRNGLIQKGLVKICGQEKRLGRLRLVASLAEKQLKLLEVKK